MVACKPRKSVVYPPLGLQTYTEPKQLQVERFKGNLSCVDMCPNSPMYGMTYCQHHREVMGSTGHPVKLREVLVGGYMKLVKPAVVN